MPVRAFLNLTCVRPTQVKTGVCRMQPTTIKIPKIPTSHRAGFPIFQSCVHKVRRGFYRLKLLRHHARSRSLNALTIWFYAFRSLIGRIGIQSSRELPSVDYGPELGRSPVGDLRVNTRTLARNMYTQMLLAKYSWADTVDLRMFLMGFDAGEQWSSCNLYSETEKPVASASWLESLW